MKRAANQGGRQSASIISMSEDQALASAEPHTVAAASASEVESGEGGSIQDNLQQSNSMASEVTTSKEVPMSPLAPKPTLP
jgi:hypothetical protein